MPDRQKSSRLALPVLLTLAALISSTASAQDAEGWISLFDGQSLDGWKVNENPDSFQVEDGCIVAHGPRAHLFYVGPEGAARFENFVFEAEVLTRPSANSGVFFHTAFQDSGWPAQGYEVQVNTSQGDPIKTGSLYGVVKVNPAPSKDDEWFRLRFQVVGRRVVTSVNGKVQVDFVEDPAEAKGPRRLSSGTFALQAHDPGSEVRYRKLRVRPLPAQEELSRADRVALREGPWFRRMDHGPFLTSVVKLDDRDVVEKAITFELDPRRSLSLTFDTNQLRMAAAWAGPLRVRGTPYDGAHGTFSEAGGPLLFHVDDGPGWSHRDSWEDAREIPHGPIPRDHGDFLGLYRHGEQVVVSYEVQGRRIDELPSAEAVDGLDSVVRSFRVAPGDAVLRMAVADEPGRSLLARQDGRALISLGSGEEPGLLAALRGAPAGVRLEAAAERMVLVIPARAEEARFQLALTTGATLADTDRYASGASTAPDLAGLMKGGPSLWPEVLVVEGVRGADDGPYAVDDIPIPFENPWQSSMRIGGMDFFSDGDRIAVSTWNGDVWVVSGLNGDWSELRWKRFAAGLYEPLGLCIVDDVILVNGRDQLTRLHDLDGDGEADFYESFNNDVLTTRNFHEFTFDLQRDAEGNFYFSKGGPVRPGGRGFDEIVPHHGTVMKVTPDGSTLSVVSTGMRAPNGIGVGPDGQLTAGDNEGSWVPRCKLHWLKPGSFQGVIPTAHRAETPTDYNPPLCFFPMEIDNSGGSQVWVAGDRWGMADGTLLHLSYGQSSIYRVLWEEKDGVAQGGVVKLPIRLGSSAMRARFHPVDGQLYVCGLRGWQTNAARLSALQRIRSTGQPLLGPEALHIRAGGIELRFPQALDRELAEDVGSWSIQQWNYVWGPMYGSPEVSAVSPDPEVLERALKTEMKDYRVRDTVEVRSARLSEDGRRVFLEVADLRPVMQMKIDGDLETEGGDEVIFELHNTIHWMRPNAR